MRLSRSANESLLSLFGFEGPLRLELLPTVALAPVASFFKGPSIVRCMCSFAENLEETPKKLRTLGSQTLGSNSLQLVPVRRSYCWTPVEGTLALRSSTLCTSSLSKIVNSRSPLSLKTFPIIFSF